MTFGALDVALLKIAVKATQSVAKSAKSAAKKAYLTQAESEAHELIGYADEALVFLEKPEGAELNEFQLSFGHRTALRTGCLIKIDEIEDIADDQTDCLVDADGISATRKRADDYRRIELYLRTLDDPQTEMPLESTGPLAPTDDGGVKAPELFDDQPIVGEGPFEGEGVQERRALPAPRPADDEIAEADFEIVEEDDDAGDPNDPTSAAWLAAELRDESIDDEIDDDSDDEEPYADDAAIDDDSDTPAAAPTEK
jgi:hypothetical protein